jgi:hypothetical protein
VAKRYGRLDRSPCPLRPWRGIDRPTSRGRPRNVVAAVSDQPAVWSTLLSSAASVARDDDRVRVGRDDIGDQPPPLVLRESGRSKSRLSNCWSSGNPGRGRLPHSTRRDLRPRIGELGSRHQNPAARSFVEFVSANALTTTRTLPPSGCGSSNSTTAQPSSVIPERLHTWGNKRWRMPSRHETGEDTLQQLVIVARVAAMHRSLSTEISPTHPGRPHVHSRAGHTHRCGPGLDCRPGPRAGRSGSLAHMATTLPQRIGVMIGGFRVRTERGWTVSLLPDPTVARHRPPRLSSRSALSWPQPSGLASYPLAARCLRSAASPMTWVISNSIASPNPGCCENN